VKPAGSAPPEALEPLRREVEAALGEHLPPEDRPPVRLHRAMRYAVLGGGKRLRPVLCLAACEAVGGRRHDALPAACALEMIHTYSLVHDDLPALDDDELRRGRATVHVAFDEATAVLVGDALHCEGLTLLAREPASVPGARRLAVLREVLVAVGTEGMIGGQMDDLETEGRALAEKELTSIHRRKTGALLTASVRAGALLGGAEGERLACLGRYGRALGLAFQIVDDVLDVTGTRESLGKSPGKDAAAHKTTYPTLLGLDGARGRAEELAREAVEALAPLGERGDLLASLARYTVARMS
jgi:geranylgeranyl pyrophosphate synthase